MKRLTNFEIIHVGMSCWEDKQIRGEGRGKKMQDGPPIVGLRCNLCENEFTYRPRRKKISGKVEIECPAKGCPGFEVIEKSDWKQLIKKWGSNEQ